MTTVDNKLTANCLLINDYTKKHLASNKKRLDPKKDPLLPPPSESPFGDFPKYLKNPSKKITTSPSKKLEKKIEGKQSESPKKEIIKKKTGIGGKTSSLLKPKEKPKPPKPISGAFKRRKITPSEFRRFYDRGDLPIAIDHKGTGNEIQWKVEIEKLDYHHYLPIFFDGLREKVDPYRFLAVEGTLNLLERGGSKIVNCIPQLIIPIKEALNTRDPEIVCTVLKVLQSLVVSNELVGEALVPYYRQILPVINLFKTKNINSGDAIVYGQVFNVSLY